MFQSVCAVYPGRVSMYQQSSDGGPGNWSPLELVHWSKYGFSLSFLCAASLGCVLESLLLLHKKCNARSCSHLVYLYCAGPFLILYNCGGYAHCPIFSFFLQFYKPEEKLHLGFYIPLTSWNLLEGVHIGPWISADALDLHLFQLYFLISQSLYSRLAGLTVCCFWHKVKKCSVYYSREGHCSLFIGWASVAFVPVLFLIYLCFLLDFPTFLFPLL